MLTGWMCVLSQGSRWSGGGIGKLLTILLPDLNRQEFPFIGIDFKDADLPRRSLFGTFVQNEAQ
jgi:hypothetical protein